MAVRTAENGESSPGMDGERGESEKHSVVYIVQHIIWRKRVFLIESRANMKIYISIEYLI